jgi:integrase
LSNPKLTDARCRAAKCPPDRASIRLTDSGGLYLDVLKGGTKTWRGLIRNSSNGYDRVSFGHFPDVSLSNARLLCAEKKTEAIDAQSAVRHEKKITFEEVTGLWRQKWGADKSPATREKIDCYLRNRLIPSFGPRPIVDLRTKDFADFVIGIDDEGFSEAARNIFDICKQICRFALTHGIIESSPVAGILPSDLFKKAQTKNRARIEFSEIKEFFEKVDLYHGWPTTKLAIMFLAHTFLRTQEMRLLRWEWINFDTAEINIPETVMKMRTPHLVPLSTQMVALLIKARSAVEARYGEFNASSATLVFPGNGSPNTCISENTILKLIAKVGYKYKMTGHGFRGLASTHLNEMKFPEDIVEAQLSHVQGATRRAYNYAIYADERRKMMQYWSDTLDDAIAGRGLKKPDFAHR